MDIKYINLTLNLALLIKIAIGKKIVTTRAEIWMVALIGDNNIAIKTLLPLYIEKDKINIAKEIESPFLIPFVIRSKPGKKDNETPRKMRELTLFKWQEMTKNKSVKKQIKKKYIW